MKKTVFRPLVLAAALLLCGCGHKPREIHIYSNGTSAVMDEVIIPERNTGAEFYVPDGMVTDYMSKNLLSEKELEIYGKALTDLGNLRETIPLYIDSSTLQRILDVIRLEQLAYTQVSDRRTVVNPDTQQFEVQFRYRFTADELSSMNIAAERAARQIMDQLTPDMDDYGKLKFFHDYLVLNCENDTESPYSDTVYGALVQKKALCEGYAKAYSYLCNLAGIENFIVTGQTTVPHMWNMVKLDGNWYHVDVTWDNSDDDLRRDYPGVILYQYFMVTDSVIKNNRTISDYPAEPPRAMGRNENYFVREGFDISREEEFLTVSENAILNAVSKRQQGAMVKFSSSDLYISVTSMLMNRQDSSLFEPITSQAAAEYGVSIRLNWTDYYKQYRILTYIIEYND